MLLRGVGGLHFLRAFALIAAALTHSDHGEDSVEALKARVRSAITAIAKEVP
jgi:hypothetical protein